MKTKWFHGFFVVLFLISTSCLAVAAEEKLASSVTAYMAVTPENNQVLADFIKKKLGVEVKQQYMSCGEIQAKMTAEAPRFSADMVIHACEPQAFLAKEKGWSLPYDSPNWRGLDKVWKDPDNHWFSHGTLSFFLVGSKKNWPKRAIPCRRAGMTSWIRNGRGKSLHPLR